MDEDRQLRQAQAVSRRIVVALVVTLVLRVLSWMFSFFMVGPVLGIALIAEPFERFGLELPVLLEGVLTAWAVTFAILVAVGVRRDPERWLGRAKVFGYALAIQTVLYVVSFVVAIIWDGLTNPAWLIATVVALNIPVFLLALSIYHKPAPRRRLAAG